MDPQTQLSLFGAWRHPAMGGIQGIQGMGMDLTQAAYRYNQNMMEYYTCKTRHILGSYTRSWVAGMLPWPDVGVIATLDCVRVVS